MNWKWIEVYCCLLILESGLEVNCFVVYFGMHAACHEHLHLWHLHWKICHNLMVMTVPVQHLGMQLHTLLGMQAGDLSLHSYAYMGVIQYSLLLIWTWSCNLHLWSFETLIH